MKEMKLCKRCGTKLTEFPPIRKDVIYRCLKCYPRNKIKEMKEYICFFCKKTKKGIPKASVGLIHSACEKCYSDLIKKERLVTKERRKKMDEAKRKDGKNPNWYSDLVAKEGW